MCLPPDYAQSRDRRYPVVFLLHGENGDDTDWFNPQKGSALKTLQTLYAQNKLLPSIITPDGNDLRGKNSKYDPDYFDGSHGKVSTAIGDELVKLVANGEYVTEARKFHALLDRLNVKNEFNQFPGTHSWRYWRAHLTDSLTYVDEQLRKKGNG